MVEGVVVVVGGLHGCKMVGVVGIGDVVVGDIVSWVVWVDVRVILVGDWVIVEVVWIVAWVVGIMMWIAGVVGG